MPCYQANSNIPPGLVPIGPGGFATEAECLEACKEGACCNGTTCSVKPQCQCDAAAGEVFNGVGTVCPCTFNTSMRLAIEEVSDQAGGIGTSQFALGTFDLAPVHNGCTFLEYQYFNLRPPKRLKRTDGWIFVALMDVKFRIFYATGQWRLSVQAPSQIEEIAEEEVASASLDNYLNNCAPQSVPTVNVFESLEVFGRTPPVLCEPYSVSFTTPQIYNSCQGAYPNSAFNVSINAVLNPLP